MWDFDAVSLYPSAMWAQHSFHPKIETGHVYRMDKNDELFEKFKNGNFIQGSVLLKIKYHNAKI